MSRKRPRVAVDLDATLAHHDKWQGLGHIGDPLPGAKEFLQKLSQVADIVVFTARMNYAFNGLATDEDRKNMSNTIASWFKKHDLPYNEIYESNGKAVCHAYVDDRGVGCRPQEDSNAYSTALEQISKLIKREI